MEKGTGADSEYFWLTMADGMQIYIHQWKEVQNPKGVVQIFHGMAEHTGRYQGFAKFLNENGYIVYADDHRGHGRTAGSIEKLGFIGKDGFNRIVEDEHTLAEFIKKAHPGLPIYLFAHSFGSFIGQAYITKYGQDISGIILSGSAALPPVSILFGRILSRINLFFFDESRKSKMLDAICFSSSNKRIKNPKSQFSWLSRDEDEVKEYEADEFCGTIFPINYFYHLFKGLNELYKPGVFDRIPKKLPIYIIAGSEDPVGSYTKNVRRLYKMYLKEKIDDLDMRLYPGGRHEMLNEINRGEVYKDIINWLINH